MFIIFFFVIRGVQHKSNIGSPKTKSVKNKQRHEFLCEIILSDPLFPQFVWGKFRHFFTKIKIFPYIITYQPISVSSQVFRCSKSQNAKVKKISCQKCRFSSFSYKYKIHNIMLNYNH